jgi:hypothetical protein
MIWTAVMSQSLNTYELCFALRAISTGIRIANHEMMSGEAVKVFSGEGEAGDGEAVSSSEPGGPLCSTEH